MLIVFIVTHCFESSHGLSRPFVGCLYSYETYSRCNWGRRFPGCDAAEDGS